MPFPSAWNKKKVYVVTTYLTIDCDLDYSQNSSLNTVEARNTMYPACLILPKNDPLHLCTPFEYVPTSYNIYKFLLETRIRKVEDKTICDPPHFVAGTKKCAIFLFGSLGFDNTMNVP